MRIFLPLLFVFLFLTGVLSAQNISVLTQHNNNTRSGYNDRETKLNTANVNPRQFGKAFSLAVDDQVYAQPLVVANLNIGGTVHNVVYIATVNNSVYAYDGDKNTLYWHKNYSAAGMRPPKNTDMTGACGGFYQDFSGNMGIVGTPVIDSVAKVIYFVARSTNGSSFVQYLHAVNILNGNEIAGSPVKITASIAGNGDGNVNNVVSFDPQKNNQRPALTLLNGLVYIGFSSHCDWGPYHGWLLGYDKQTLQQKIVYNTTPNGYEAGIWESGCGPAVDSQGNLYVVTGNGSVGTNGDPTNLINRGESALKLTPNGNTLKVSSYFTPFNYSDLENSDLDYGSMGSFLIPNSNYYFTGCKDGNLYLLNKDNMGGYSAGVNNVQQTINLNQGKTLRCQPTYFKGTTKEFVYVWSENDPLRAFPFNRGANTLDVNNQVVGSANGPGGANGAELAVSSDAGKDGTGIVWAAYAASGDANQSVRPGILRAFDANNITTELWNNSQNPGRDNAGNFAKFAAPTIANGHVYLATFSNQVAVYGVVDTTSGPATCSNVNLALNKPAFSSANESDTYPPGNATDGNGTSRWSSAFSDPQWIYVDLRRVDSLCRVSLSWEVALGKDFLIQVSTDAQHWNTVATITNNTSFLNYIDIVAKGRYVRMYGTARGTPYGYSLYEFAVNGKELSGCQSPNNLSYHGATPASVILKWAATGGTGYTVAYAPSGSNQFKTLTTTADSITLTGLGCSTNYIWKVRTECGASSSAYSAQSSFSTQGCINCGLLPTRVLTTDIGNVNIVGQACYTGVTSYNVKGSGGDIYGNADQFRYVYKTFGADGTIQAKVTSQDQTNPYNKAGLMFRQTTDSTSANIFTGITSANGVTFQSRLAAGAITTTTDLAGAKAPYFLRLVKQGQLYTGYASADSISWAQIFSTVSTMGDAGPISGGLAVTSHDNTTLSTVQFDQVGLYLYSNTDINLALNKPSYGSNFDQASHKGNFGNDGDTNTFWNSAAGTDAQWYYVDLGQPFKLRRVNINWSANIGSDYQLQVSDDAITWNTVQQITGNTISQNSVLLPSSGRFVRLYGTKSAGNAGYGINEMQIFGDTIPTTIQDIARNKPAKASTDAGASYAAAKAVDGDFTTRWASTQADPQWIYVDLGKTYNIANVNITWELDVAKDFVIQGSADAMNWTTLKSFSNNAAYTNFVPLSGKARYLRVYGTAKNGGDNYSIFDIQVLGSPASSTGPSNTPPVKFNIDKFAVYANPNRGKFSVDFISLKAQNIQLMITNAMGQIFKKETLDNFVGAYTQSMDLSSAAAGAYVVSIITPDGIVSLKMIKL